MVHDRKVEESSGKQKPVPVSAPTFSLSFRVTVTVALPTSRISCTYQLGCQGKKGDPRTRGWLSSLPFEALADVSSSTRGSHVPNPFLLRRHTQGKILSDVPVPVAGHSQPP